MKNLGVSFLVSFSATGSAIGVAFLDYKFGADICKKIYDGDNQYIKSAVEYGIPAVVSAIIPGLSFSSLGKGAIVPVISAIAQTCVMKYCETPAAVEESFFTAGSVEEQQVNSDL